MIKNKESKIFQAVNTLNTEHKISLSGTPIENSLSDLWSQMQFINPGMLGSYSFFKENYLLPIERYADEAALDHLKTLVEPFILRRRKEDVAKDLPPLSEQIEYVYMEKLQAQIYEQEKSAARNHLLNMDEKDPSYKFQIFQSLMFLRQISNHPVLADKNYKGSSGKFNDVIDKLETIIKADHKVLIFSSFTAHLALFQAHFQQHNLEYAILTGSSSQKQRKENVIKFQTNRHCQIFLISIKAGGTGLNLTEADYVFILDPWWNPFVEDQAIARAHRIGQDKPVSVLKFISKDSIEEKIVRLQARKKVLSAEIIEKPEQLSLAKADLKDLLS
jgi:non-specific serine/threonine protein kinase